VLLLPVVIDALLNAMKFCEPVVRVAPALVPRPILLSPVTPVLTALYPAFLPMNMD